MVHASIEVLYRAVRVDMGNRNRILSHPASYDVDNVCFMGSAGVVLTGTVHCLPNSVSWFDNHIESIVTSTCSCTSSNCRKECVAGDSLWITGFMDVGNLGSDW